MSPTDLTRYRRIRSGSFHKALPLNDRLLQMSAGHPSHRFLANPAAHNVYVYLGDYVKCFAEEWFGRPLSSLRILDWGCGKGHMSLILREMQARVVSCDIERDAGDSAFGQEVPIIEQAGIEVVPLRHEYRLPFESESFDIALSVGVLEHVPDDRQSLQELARVLKPHGLLFCFFLPCVTSWTQAVMRGRGDHYHDRLYSARQVRALLRGAGLDLVDLWHRALLPKNSVRYPAYRFFEWVDQLLASYTPLRLLATNVEFVASKGAQPERRDMSPPRAGELRNQH